MCCPSRDLIAKGWLVSGSKGKGQLPNVAQKFQIEVQMNKGMELPQVQKIQMSEMVMKICLGKLGVEPGRAVS